MYTGMKHILIVVFSLVCLSVSAQENNNAFRFGYLSYNAALQSMEAYATVQQQMADLKKKYEAEMKRVEKDFNRKYEEFLDGQREYPKTILQKRQTELQEMMAKNIAFKDKSRAELARAEQEAMAPLRIKLIELIGTIARDKRL